jgi:hypothetical protein
MRKGGREGRREGVKEGGRGGSTRTAVCPTTCGYSSECLIKLGVILIISLLRYGLSSGILLFKLMTTTLPSIISIPCISSCIYADILQKDGYYFTFFN